MLKHRRSPQWGDSQPCLTTITRLAFIATVGLICLLLGVVSAFGAPSSRMATQSGKSTGGTGMTDNPSMKLAASAASSGTISLQIPAACLSPTATHRTYPLNIPAADTYARSGEHGHGRLTCIVFMTRTYSKILVVDQAAGGYKLGPLGLDVSYVDCGLPGYRFPPPPFTGANDCGESWGSTEGDWRYQSGPAIGQQMFPAATP